MMSQAVNRKPLNILGFAGMPLGVNGIIICQMNASPGYNFEKFWAFG
jgi:hypothetical protein